MRILAIDPGTTHSGIVVISEGKEIILAESDVENILLIQMIRAKDFSINELVIEHVASYGMAVGQTTFTTVLWIGKFMEAFKTAYLKESHKVYRKEVKIHLCNSMRAKDKNIRQAIIDRYPPNGGGKTPQIGTKNQPGGLYGVSSHAMSALAVALTYIEGGAVDE